MEVNLTVSIAFLFSFGFYIVKAWSFMSKVETQIEAILKEIEELKRDQENTEGRIREIEIKLAKNRINGHGA